MRPFHHAEGGESSHTNTLSRSIFVYIVVDLSEDMCTQWPECCEKVLRPSDEPCRLSSEDVGSRPARANTTERYAVGVDFGGTGCCPVSSTSKRARSWAKKRTQASDGPDELMIRLIDTIDSSISAAGLTKKGQVLGIGVGIAGQVDKTQGVLLGAPNLSQATVDLPMARLLTERFGMPAALRNDVQIAAMGEAASARASAIPISSAFSLARGSVGTSCAAGCRRRHRLRRRDRSPRDRRKRPIMRLRWPWAPRSVRLANGDHAVTDRRGATWPRVGTARTGAGSGGGRTGRRDPLRDFARAISRQDALVTETIIEAANYLGLGLASAVNLLNPSRIILGGGVIEAVDLLLEIAAGRTRREALATPGKQVEIVKAKLGDNSGVVGAARPPRREQELGNDDC